jgi:signal transduction histidine kinase
MLMPPSRIGLDLDASEQRVRRIVGVIPYLALAVSVLLTAMQGGQSRSYWLRLAVVVAVAFGWMLSMLWISTVYPAWTRRRALPIAYFAGLLVLIAILIAFSPLFGFFAFTGYLHATELLTGLLRFAGVGATALLTSLSQAGGIPLPSWVSLPTLLVVVAINLTIASVMTFFSWFVNEQSDKRGQMVVELSQTNRKLEEAMAENAGLHAQLLTQAREAGVHDERQRMAREIHDTLAQGLIGIITQLGAAAQTETQPADWRRHLDTAAGLARESLSEARRSVHALRPEALESAQLPEALAEVVQRWSAVNRVSAEMTTTGTATPMHPDVEVTLLRTAQEALANVAKHASAARVGVTLSYMDDVVTLDVRDDGTGFVPRSGGLDGLAVPGSGGRSRGPDGVAGSGGRPRGPGGPAVAGSRGAGGLAGRGGGFGLTAMRQRLDRIGGTLDIESEPGTGTAVSASVPAWSPAVAAQQGGVVAQQGGVVAQQGGVVAQQGGVVAQQGGVVAQQGGVVAQQASAGASVE